MGKLVMFFNSTHHVIKAEAVLASSGIEVKVVPVPPRIKADCGVALRFETSLASEIETVLKQENIPYDSIHLVK